MLACTYAECRPSTAGPLSREWVLTDTAHTTQLEQQGEGEGEGGEDVSCSTHGTSSRRWKEAGV